MHNDVASCSAAASNQGGKHVFVNEGYSTVLVVVMVEGGSFVSFLTPQQHASVSQGRINSDCYTEIYVADQCFSVSPSHSILKPGQPVPVLTL